MLNKLCNLWLLCLLPVLLCLQACDTNTPKLAIGYIKPSVNHLPLSYALSQNPDTGKQYTMYAFSSGWEAQEALAAGKLDMTILPFTYAWTLRSRGYKVKTLACLERETDGIITTDKIKLPADLNHTRIGLLRASSLEALLDDYAVRNAVTYKPVFFRTPTELTEALLRGEVDAIVSYVPLIQKMPDRLQVLHWFADDYPGHPCCNLVVTEKAIQTKSLQIKRFNALLQEGVDAFNAHSSSAFDFMAKYYALSPEMTSAALQHVQYMTNITARDKAFERRMMQDFIHKGYLKSLPADSEMYYKTPE